MKPVTDPALLEQLNGGSQAMKPVSDPNILAQLNGEQPQAEPMNKDGAFSRGLDVIKNAVKGNAEFEDATSYEDWLWSQPNLGVSYDNIATTLAGMAGTDKDKLNSFVKRNPDKQVQFDASNNPYFVDKEQDNKKVYLDFPGLDAGDIVDFIGESTAYGKAYQAAKGVGTGLKGAAAVSGATGATNAGLQKVAGRDEINKGEVALFASLAGGMDIVTPYAGKLFSWVKNKINGSDGSLEAGEAIAKNAGVNLDDQASAILGKMRSTVDDSVPDDALIAELKHGIKLTRGQATGSINQMSKEEGLRNQTVLMDRFKQIDDFNRDAVDSNLQGIRKGLYDGVDDALQPQATAETALDGLKTAARESKASYQQAYKNIDSVGDATGGIAVKKNADLVQNIKSKIDEVITVDSTTPKAKAALKDISKRLEKIDDGTGVTIKDYENLRRRISSKFSGQMDSTDKKALTMAKDELDNWFYNSVDNSLMSGSPEQLKQLQKARGLMTDYMNRFQSKDKSKKVIAKIINDDVTPEEFSNMLTGVNGYNKAGAGNAVNAYKDAVGADSEAFKALQANVFEKLIMGGTSPRTGEAAMKGYEGLVGTFNQAFTRKGTSMMKALYNKDTANEIKSLMRSVGKLIKPDEVKNASGSARLGAQILSQSGARFPILSNIYRGLKNLRGYTESTTKPMAIENLDASKVAGVLQAGND